MSKITIKITDNKLIMTYKDGENKMKFKPHYWHKDNLVELFAELAVSLGKFSDAYHIVNLDPRSNPEKGDR